MTQTAEDLVLELAEYSSDPLGFVYFAFPWGEEGELEGQFGPEPWQREILVSLGEGLGLPEAVQLARTSGHGIGKSALVAWIMLWAISTFADTKGVVTANTETQLKTKTWVELAKWYRLFLCRDMFKMTATAMFSTDPEHERTWRIDMVPWSERNTEAFAGLHNQDKRILIVFDEASAIPDLIFEVTEGALTDKPPTQIIWAVFGNPTRNTGRFRECFHGGKFAHRWDSAAIDSRQVSFTNKEQIARWIEDYGEDHDFVRVRVRGVFPRVDAISFIPLELVREAIARETPEAKGNPVILGVDVGRYGDDPSVIYPRKGRDGYTLIPEVYHGLSTMQLAKRVVEAMTRYSATVCYVDEGGVGGGVVDRLVEDHVNVIGVQFGGRPDGSNLDEPQVTYANKRAEMWGGMRDWLSRGKIPEKVPGLEQLFTEELTGPTFTFNNKDAILLEKKQDMRRRGVPSPNLADALALTFAHPVYVPNPRYPWERGKPELAPDFNPLVTGEYHGNL